MTSFSDIANSVAEIQQLIPAISAEKQQKRLRIAFEHCDSRVTADGEKSGGLRRWYCLPCGKSYKSKFSLERHERTNKHLREVREIQRLSQLAPTEDPDQAEYWEHHEEVDWQVYPPNQARSFRS